MNLTTIFRFCSFFVLKTSFLDYKYHLETKPLPHFSLCFGMNYKHWALGLSDR